MPRIVSIGEGMVEMAPLAEADCFRMGFAGDTLNTAWYLRRLLPGAWQVDYLTAVGTDGPSDRMVAFLDRAGIGTATVMRRRDRTIGLYLIELRDGERSFAYWRGQSAARTLADDPDALRAGLTGADLVYLSGITVAILAPEARARLFAVLDEVRAAGVPVALDPNLRPRLWATADEMTAAITRAARSADILLPSHEDEAAWFGDVDPEATARRYAALGAGCVVVKNGAGPILALAGGQVQSHAPVAVDRVVDSTAAGDSFNAGFLACHLTGGAMAAAVARGAGLAARVIGGRGALVEAALTGA